MMHRARRGVAFRQSLATAGRARADMAVMARAARAFAFRSQFPPIPCVAFCVSKIFCRGYSQSQRESAA